MRSAIEEYVVTYPGFDRVMPEADYLIASAEFPTNWTRDQDPLEGLRRRRSRFDLLAPDRQWTLAEKGRLKANDDTLEKSTRGLDLGRLGR